MLWTLNFLFHCQNFRAHYVEQSYKISESERAVGVSDKLLLSGLSGVENVKPMKQLEDFYVIITSLQLFLFVAKIKRGNCVAFSPFILASVFLDITT